MGGACFFIGGNFKLDLTHAVLFYFCRIISTMSGNEGKPLPPPCQPLLPASPDDPASPSTTQDQGVKMRKELGLLEGTSIILGIIMGSGD